MKLSRIKTLIRETKRAYVFPDERGMQWIGDGMSMYPADGGIEFTKENILSIMDIDQNKQKQYTVREGGAILDVLGLEPRADEVKLYPDFSVDYLGDLITLMHTEDGLVVGVEQKRIAPADGELPLEFRLRRSGRGYYAVACYADIFCNGLIAPVEHRIGDTIMKWMQHALEQPKGYYARTGNAIANDMQLSIEEADNE